MQLPKYETAMLQDLIELTQFIELLKQEKVSSYLEIGSKHGGSLWRIGSSLPKGSRIVSIDLPHGDQSFKETLPHLQACVSRLSDMGYDAHLKVGDSTDPQTIEWARVLGPFDCCFIDANHTEPYVRKDFANYGPMARMVAFHDIGWRKREEPTNKMPIDVPQVWAEIKNGHRYTEFRMCARDNGIGVLWH